VIWLDRAFFDQKLQEVLEELDIDYILASKLYEDIRDYCSWLEPPANHICENRFQQWQYVELEDRRSTWNWFCRALLRRALYENTQRLLESVCPDQILYTNLSCSTAVDKQVCRSDCVLRPRSQAIMISDEMN